MSKNFFMIITFAAITVLAGCASPGSPTTIPDQAAPTPSAMPSSTPPPPTPTSLPPVGVILASQEADRRIVNEVKPIITSWMDENGYPLQRLETLTMQSFNEGAYKYVVAVYPQPNVDVLAEAFPKTDFLAVGFSDLQPRQNLSVIPSGQAFYDQQGFIAGYIAAMITPDWRVAAVGVRDHEPAQQAREAFVLGVRYFCGLCRPEYPPYYEYPLFIELDQEASLEQWQSSANVLVNKNVETIYVVPGAGGEDLLRFLVGADVNVISEGRFYREEFREAWVASLEFDLLGTFRDYWPDFVAGDTGKVIQPPLIIEDVNQDLLSPGRLRNAESTLEQVEKGWIKTTRD